MLTNRKALPKSRVALTITVTAAEYRQAFAAELAAVAQNVNLPGFRPGKAPLEKVLTQVNRQRLEAGALDRALSASYSQTVREAELIPVQPADLEIITFTAPGDETAASTEVVTYKAEVDVLPPVRVQGYQKLKVKEPAAQPVTEKEVEEVLTQLKKQRAELKPAAADAELQKGMWAEISYTGSIDGVQRSDMSNPHHPLVVGEGQLIPGFEDALVGMRVKEEKRFPITFPKGYRASELAGKRAEFTVTVNELRDMVLPEENDAFAAVYGQETLPKLVEAIRADLAKEKESKRRHQLEEEVVNALIKLIPIDLPESMVEAETERQLNETKQRLQQMKVEWPAYLSQTGQSEEQVKTELRPQSERNVRIGLILGEVLKAEGMPDGEHAARQVMDRLIAIATK